MQRKGDKTNCTSMKGSTVKKCSSPWSNLRLICTEENGGDEREMNCAERVYGSIFFLANNAMSSEV